MFQEKLVTETTVSASSVDEARYYLESDFPVKYLTTTLRDIDLHEDGTVTAEGRSWQYSEGFMRSLAKKIGMPLNYAYKIDFDLFKENFNRRKTLDCIGVKICISHGHAVNVCKADYFPGKTVDVIKNLPEKFGDFRFNEAVIDGRFVEMSWCDEKMQINPQPGDTILGGIKITNSETGFNGLRASLFTLRLVCTNGSVMLNENNAVRWSYDHRMTYNRSIDNFCKKLNILEIPKFELDKKYASATDRYLSDREVVNLWRRVRRVLTPTTTDVVLGMDNSFRQSLFDRVTLYDEPNMAQPTELNTYDIHNRITAGAKTQSPIRRTKLEEIGGSMIWN